ncbi:MAG: signal peptidase II [Spirochaetales bacterium]|nr:signal peptidase II [Spirochaetales bacterium]
MKKIITTQIVIALIIAANFAIDQGTKAYADKHLKSSPRQEILGDFLALEYAENTGAFLGAFAGSNKILRILLLKAFPLLTIIFITFLTFFSKKITILNKISFAFIIGGGLGNLYDRFFRNGYVIDFLHMDFHLFQTGIFNIADLSIMIGFALLIISLFSKKKD